MKAAILILSDPNQGSDEAVGRLFNALAVAYDFKQKGDEVTVMFNGTGARWISVLNDPEHPVFELFQAVKDSISGVSRGCADVFGATEDVENSEFDFLTENQVPGTGGLPSVSQLTSEGYTVLTF